MITLQNQCQWGSGTYSALQRNVAVTHDVARAIPQLVAVVVHVDGRPARALVDTGSG